MSNYYSNQESVANIYTGLIKRGWNCYGYRPDQSDSMTDYWSPARWEGVAEKDGFILLVDTYGTHNSGKNGYPTFEHSNPKKCNWHIEKDGKLIAKGSGAYQCTGYLFGKDEAETMNKVNTFIDRIESKMTGSEQLEEVQEEVINKVIKPVQVEKSLTDFVINQTIIKLNASFTGSHYKGELLQLVEISNYNTRTIYTFVKLGKKYQQLKRYGAASNSLQLTSDNLERWLKDGSILTMELQEIEEVTYRTVFKAVKREESKPLEVEREIEINQSIGNVEMKLNNELNGVELYFSDKPSEALRSELKLNGFRWSKYNKCWYSKQSEKAILYAESLVSIYKDITVEQEETTAPETAETPASVEEEINVIESNEQYKSDVIEVQEHQEKQPETKGKVLDFTSKFQQKQEQQEEKKALEYFTSEILPYMSFDDKMKLFEAQNDKEKFNSIMFDMVIKAKAKVNNN